ncbi:HORMA domain containing protein [Geodermatophilus sp. DSM 44513]|uniref:HORMA domain containing protein n=1 Tax=Geodermatophilus sp. DSM 44513 TaxID=1528104 RepID=UPI0012820BF4|nr:HORMA domain containing protein [Geodermatophilus sp. DSM 44513]WNV74350.1 hypothetical protein RTG05_15305 [Geodermatophilus sp. DSM 44513]
MSTRVSVSTYTHATTFVANNLLRSIKRLVTGAGLPADNLIGNWEVMERGVATWLGTGHLSALVLEIYTAGSAVPRGLVARFDFTIDYGYSPDGDGDLWLDSDAVAFALKKAGVSAVRCNYRVVADAAFGYPAVDGWSDTTLRSTTGFTRHSLGTSITGGALGADLSYYGRTA